jgi:hypothetical protein
MYIHLCALFFQDKFKQNNLFGGQIEEYLILRLEQNGLEKITSPFKTD